MTPVEWSFEKATMDKAYAKLPAFDRDIAKAKQSIKDAGAEGASAEIMVGTGWQEQLGLATQDAGRAIGLNLTLKKLPLQTMYAAILNAKSKNYDVVHRRTRRPTCRTEANAQQLPLPRQGLTNQSTYGEPEGQSAAEPTRWPPPRSLPTREVLQGQADHRSSTESVLRSCTTSPWS